MRDQATFRVTAGLPEMLKGWRDHFRRMKSADCVYDQLTPAYSSSAIRVATRPGRASSPPAKFPASCLPALVWASVPIRDVASFPGVRLRYGVWKRGDVYGTLARSLRRAARFEVGGEGMSTASCG
jgi:hypothetical protein